MKVNVNGNASLLFGLVLAAIGVTSPAHAEPRRDMVWEDVDASTVAPAVNSNVIFLNQCKNGCQVHCNGGTDSRTDSSSVCPGGTRTLTKFKAGDQVWASVVQCVKETFAPFGVVITDVDPGSANHFEIMIAGNDTDIGLSGTGGVSPFNCGVPYIPNSLVFDFADTYGTDVNEICAVAAQEIAHSFALDHVTEASDPLTYFPYASRRHFKDAAVKCGSDCVGGQGPFGQNCGGVGGQEHSCSCTGSPTQNSVATMKALFGNGAITPPTVTITRPKNGDNVVPGFPINTNVVDDIGVSKVELRIDGMLLTTVDAFPYVFNAPTTLADGTHRVEVTGYDISGTPAKAVATVYIGPPCTKPADCTVTTDTCVGGRCVPGSGVQGGLGSMCANNEACASGLCVNGESNGMVCSDTCELDVANSCPAGFQCIAAGSIAVCYPGGDDGGGCVSGGAPTGPIVFGLAFGALVLRRRRTPR